MKEGKTLQALSIELERQRQSKRDFIADTRKIRFVPQQTRSGNYVNMAIANGSTLEFQVNHIAHSQIAQRLNIPKAYYDRMLNETPDLLSKNVNHWLDVNGGTRLVRTLDNTARAFLSNRYRRLDNFDLASAVLPELADAGVSVESSEITDRRMYIKAINQNLTAEVVPGDVVCSGVIISNSEVGYGQLSVESLLYRLVCKNGLIRSETIKRRHLGGIEIMDGDITELLSDETQRITDEALWRQVRDVVRGVLKDLPRFEQTVEVLRSAKLQGPKISKPIETIELTAKEFQLQEKEKDSVLAHLIEGGDLSRYGLVNAITRAAQDVESYDRSVDLERLGNTVLELPNAAWGKLVSVN